MYVSNFSLDLKCVCVNMLLDIFYVTLAICIYATTDVFFYGCECDKVMFEIS